VNGDKVKDIETRSSSKSDFLARLEYKAQENSGYIKYMAKKGLISESDIATRSLFGWGKKPEGYIKVLDNTSNEVVPVPGIQISV
jgi:hypothetical protein